MLQGNSGISNLGFHDLTRPSVSIANNVQLLLGLNLNFCPTPSNTKPSDFQKAFARFQRSIRLTVFLHNLPSNSRSYRYVVSAVQDSLQAQGKDLAELRAFGKVPLQQHSK